MVVLSNSGEALFRVYLPDASCVELVGDFTDWTRSRVKLHREPPGWWEAKLSMSPGKHMFYYIVDGMLQLADYAAHGVKLDRHGQWLSEVNVSECSLAETKPGAASTVA